MPRHYAEFYSPDHPCRVSDIDGSLDDYATGEEVPCWAVRDAARCGAVCKVDEERFTTIAEGNCIEIP